MQTLPFELDDDALRSAVASVLLVAGGPVDFGDLATACSASVERVREAVLHLTRERRGGIRVQSSGSSAQLVTAPENVEAVHRFLGTSKPPPLGRSTLEALTVVAYRQPVTRSEIEAVRGVNSDRAVQVLLARGLIEERGTRPTLGRPVEFGTTWAFLEYFGLRSLDDLPPLPGEQQTELSLVDIGFRQDRDPENER